nr:ribosome maturation factor RimM [Variibacter gotjawalensis]
MTGASSRVCVAQIGAAHGIRGEVRLRSFTGEPEAIKRYGALETEDGKRSLEIVSLRPQKDMFVARLKGVDDRNAAEALRNTRLYVSRERFGKTEEDEFFHADLIGLDVFDRGGTKLGSIAAVENFGAGDLIEIAPVSGDPTYYLPFTKRAVPEIDIAGKRVVVDPPSEIEGDEEEA